MAVGTKRTSLCIVYNLILDLSYYYNLIKLPVKSSKISHFQALALMSKVLFKNKEDGMIFGVCAGLSDATGIDVSLVRIATFLGAIATGSIVFWLYLLLAIFLPKKN